MFRNFIELSQARFSGFHKGEKTKIHKDSILYRYTEITAKGDKNVIVRESPNHDFLSVSVSACEFLGSSHDVINARKFVSRKEDALNKRK